jgi:hypothetical protein
LQKKKQTNIQYYRDKINKMLSCLRPKISASFLARSNLILTNGARSYARGAAPQYQQTLKGTQVGKTMKERLMGPTTGARTCLF